MDLHGRLGLALSGQGGRRFAAAVDIHSPDRGPIDWESRDGQNLARHTHWSKGVKNDAVQGVGWMDSRGDCQYEGGDEQMTSKVMVKNTVVLSLIELQGVS